MAGKYYVISDGYYREEYPMSTNLDVEKFYSCQRIEQNTTLYDLLGDNIADYLLETILPKESPDAWESEFLEKVQMLMVFYVAKSLESFNGDRSNDNKVSSINSKIEFYKRRLRTYIEDSAELQVIKDDDTEPDRESYQGFPTYFYR